MKTATVTLRSLAPYNASRMHFVPKDDKESHDAYEKRTWPEKAHYDDKGVAYIPPMAFKGCITNAARMLSIPIPGRGKSLYTKHFVSGIMITDCLSLGKTREEVVPQWLSMDGQGRKGGMGVMRGFPHFDKWEGTIDIHILDDTITKEVFERVLRESGNFVGVGQFRPEKGGYFGRFEVVSIKWK